MNCLTMNALNVYNPAFVATVKTFKVGQPMAEDTYIGAITRAPQLDVLDAQVDDACLAPATGTRPPFSQTSTTRWH